MKKSLFLTQPLFFIDQLKRSFLLAASLLLPLSFNAAASDALLPDMGATTTLKAPMALKQLDMSQALKRAVELNPMDCHCRY